MVKSSAGKKAALAKASTGVSAASTLTTLATPATTPTQPSNTGNAFFETAAQPLTSIERPRKSYPSPPAPLRKAENPPQLLDATW